MSDEAAALAEAIEHARAVADSYRDTAPDCSCAVEHRQLADWLEELQFRRSHKPLRCRLGLHKTKVMGMGLCGPPFLVACVLCGGRWVGM